MGWMCMRRSLVGAVVVATVTAPAAGAAEPAADDAGIVAALTQPWSGDLDGMVERGLIRVLTALSRTHFYLDGGQPRGLTYEMMEAFEAFAHERLGREVDVLVIPAPRALLLDWLLAGRGDVVAANLTVTPERSEVVAFTDPIIEDALEQVVLAASSAPIADLDELAATGTALSLREESSYFQHVQALNAERAAPIAIDVVDPRLTDEDLLDLLAGGVLQATVVDRHKLDLWAQVYPELIMPAGLVVNAGGRIAMAVRPTSPELLALLDGFVPTVEDGSLLGNILIERYLNDVARLNDREAAALRADFAEMRPIFERAAEAYDLEWTLLAAQAYEESRLDQGARGPSGAVGVMQINPATAAEPYVDLPDVEQLETNILAGAKYTRWLIDTHFAEPGIAREEQLMFALVAYNAGPGNIDAAREVSRARGLDPDRWFDHVEITTAREISHIPVEYVRNILKYHSAYRRLLAAEPAE